MRKLIVTAAAAGMLALAAPAFAGPPNGTSDTETNNNVTCGGTATVAQGRTKVYTAGGPEGGAVIVCNDAAPVPIQGRVIASGSTSGGGYVAADGDNSNPEQARGWARVDVGTAPKVRCGGPADAGSGTNAESPGSGAKLENCG